MNEIIMDNRIYNYIVHNSDINKDENKVIEFGIEMIKMLSVAAIVAILIAMIMKMLPEAVFFLFTFIPLRQNAGGYHTRHRITCAIMSVFIYIFSRNYICLFNYLFISSQMSAKPYFIGSTGILLLW